MKILHIIASANPTGGGPIEGVTQLNRVLTRLGHSTEVVSLDTPGQAWLSEMPLPVHAMGEGDQAYRYSRNLIPWLQRHASDYQLAIVNGIWQYSSFGAWRALKSMEFPYIVYPHGMLDPWFKRAYPLKHLKKRLYWRWAEYRVLRDARAVFFTSEEEKLSARQSFQPYHVNGVVVNYGTTAPTGSAEAQREQFYDAYPALRTRRLLLFLSRIHVKKGCDLLLEAFASQARADASLHLVMAGPDQTGWTAQLQARAQALGIAERITWTGMLSGDLKWGAFHAAEAFVLPSHQENFGIAVAEALACGCPVLISNKVNIWREIQTDGAGLVADDTPAGTEDLLKQWLTLPAVSRATMKQNALRCFQTRFEIDSVGHNVLQTLQTYARED
jgi:glycosyltransferase involved in cell wall biosynthesis